jgi:hypothetical protein
MLNSTRLDGLAVGLSLACLVQCLLLPAALTLFPLFGLQYTPDETLHRYLLAVALPTSALALLMGCRKHHRAWVVGAGALGLAGMLLAAFVLEAVASPAVAEGTTLTSALLLMTAHVGNFRLCRRTDCDHGFDQSDVDRGFDRPRG